MSLNVKDPGGADFKPVPEGTHVAICYSVVDLGDQINPFSEETISEVLLTWEIPGERLEDGRPHAISQRYRASLHEKAKLRAHLEGWRGRRFTEEELEGFHLRNVLGKPCLLSVAHKTTQKGSVWASVISVMALPRGADVPGKTENPLVAFDLDDPDPGIFEKLPEWVQERIKRQVRERAEASPAATAEFGEPDSTDLPFVAGPGRDP